jgi:hypothetical protein
MKLLSFLKLLIGYKVSRRGTHDMSRVELADIRGSMTCFDKVAIKVTVLLEEACKSSEMVAISIDQSQTGQTICTALAITAALSKLPMSASLAAI